MANISSKTKPYIYIIAIVWFWLFAGIIDHNSNSAWGFNSMLEFENFTQEATGFEILDALDDCFTSGKVMAPWEFGELDNTYLPQIHREDAALPQETGGISAGVTIAAVSRAAIYTALTVLFAPITFLALGVEYLIMLDTCSNAYVLQPHEYVNRDILNLKCEKDTATNTYNFATQYNSNGNNVIPLSATDVPFYYTCDPKYDFNTKGTINDEDLEGRNYGYMGIGSGYCQGTLKEVAANADFQALINTIQIEYIPGISRFFNFSGDYGSPCDAKFKFPTIVLKPGEVTPVGGYLWYSYYRRNDISGNIQICAVSPYTLLPIRVGCSQIAPPAESGPAEDFISTYLDDSICRYFTLGRKDLQSLGEALPQVDSDGEDKEYVKRFLKSEMHLTSTVTGCITDTLQTIFLGSGYENQSQSFFERFRLSLRSIVLAVLVLFICVSAIQFIIDPELQKKRGEIVMMIVTFGAVFYFTVGNAWYYEENGQKKGLLPLFMHGPAELTSVVLTAYTQNDPMGFCRYKLGQDEIFSEYEVDKTLLEGEVESTPGYNSVKMTVWDLVDCKLANYVNFGSCKYNIEGMWGVWIAGGALFSGGLGFMLVVVSILYLFLLLLIVFRFVHIFLLSMFLLTILIFFAPIFVLFALFKPTLPIFKQWFTMLIGYTLYPAVNFIFISFMLATLDLAYYGNIAELSIGENNVSSTVASQSLRERCQRATSESALCTTVDIMGWDNPCVNPSPAIPSEFKEMHTDIFGGRYYTMRADIVEIYLASMLKLLAFAILFYFLMGTMIGFLAVVLGVWFPEQDNMGGVNIFSNPITAAVGKAINKAAGTERK